MEAFFKRAGGTSEAHIVSFVELFEGILFKSINVKKNLTKPRKSDKESDLDQ